jgi:hypothetical protein
MPICWKIGNKKLGKYMYSKEELEKKIEEFTIIATKFFVENIPTKKEVLEDKFKSDILGKLEIQEFINKLTPEDAYIFGQCCYKVIEPYIDRKTGKLILK